jgi:hypothetical protein
VPTGAILPFTFELNSGGGTPLRAMSMLVGQMTLLRADRVVSFILLQDVRCVHGGWASGGISLLQPCKRCSDEQCQEHR